MDRIAEILGYLEDPTALSDEQIAALEAELLDIFAAIRAGEYDGVEPTDVATLRSVAEATTNLRALAAERFAAAEALAAEVAEIEALLDATEAEVVAETADEPVAEVVELPTEEPEAETAEVEELEPIAASAPPAAHVAARQPVRTRPRPEAPAEPTPNYRILLNGREATDAEVHEHFADTLSSGAGYFREKRRVQFAFPEGRVADESGAHHVAPIIRQMQAERSSVSNWRNGGEALTAGMWCAPAETIYDYPVLANDARPVRGALPPLNAVRGRVEVPTPVSISDIDTSGSDASVSIYTDTEFDAGTNKPVDTLPCPSFTTYGTHAVTKRLRLTNMDQLGYPEHVANYDQVVNAAHARLAEQKLLDLLKSLSTAKSEAASFGTSRDLLEAIKRAAATIRSEQRSETAMRVLLPTWVLAMAEADLIRGLQSDPSFLTNASGIFTQALADAGVNVSFYADTPTTGTSQLLSADAGAQLDAFPLVVQWGIWPEGTFIFLDKGYHDFGIVRDSTLNDDNLAEMFAESFEGIAKVGPQALWVSQSVCHDGTSGAGVDVNVCLGS